MEEVYYNGSTSDEDVITQQNGTLNTGEDSPKAGGLENEDERFRRPVATTELEEFGRSWAADNSRRKWCWVLRVFEDWRKARNKLVLKELYLEEPVYEKALSSMSDEELDDVLGKFVAEVRVA